MNSKSSIFDKIKQEIISLCYANFGFRPEKSKILIQLTSPEHIGDFTIVLFPIAKSANISPIDLGNYLSQKVIEKLDFISSTEVIKGFLNLKFSDEFWIKELSEMRNKKDYFLMPSTGTNIVLEYCGPNTNKPLHIGHIRNMMIGFSVGNILKAAGNEVHKVNIYNDRGIAISKSMVSWKRFANGATPESTGIKGDHFVGDYYVRYNKAVEDEISSMDTTGINKKDAEKLTSIHKEAQQMVQDWESGNEEVRALWIKMNQWVYNGFKQTFDLLGVDFEKDYFESETYLLGKDFVMEGVANGTFIKKEDGSVVVDLTDEGLDEKILLRSDGTSVYITQDLATAQLRYNDFNMDKMIYVVADEQNYHFKVLKLALLKMGKKWAEGIYHLSYSLVESPTGRFKSREGKTADADDLINEVLKIAEEKTKELGKVEDFTDDQIKTLYRIIGLGALKFFILRVNPFKKIIFNPEESIDFHGYTGPFIQYTYARISSVGRKAKSDDQNLPLNYTLHEAEKNLVKFLFRYTDVIESSARQYDPSELADYIYHLSKAFNKFWAEVSILGAEDVTIKNFRLIICEQTGLRIKEGMNLLGIEVPEKM